MKQVELTKRTQAELLGRMFIEDKIITSTQLNIIQRELINPTHDYNSPNSLWELYQFVTFSMKDSHPSLWMNNHIDAHEFFINSCIDIPLVTMNVDIAEAEKDFLNFPHKQLGLFEYNLEQDGLE